MLKTVPELVAEARAGLRCVDAATALSEMKENGGAIIDVRELVEVNNLAAPISVHIPRGICADIGAYTPGHSRDENRRCDPG